MTKIIPLLCCIAIIAGGCGGSSEPAPEPALEPVAEPVVEADAEPILIDAGWLAENLDDPSVRILEIGRAREGYDEGHIPNAQFVDWLEIADEDNPERFNLPKEEQLTSLLGRLGITNATTVVLYDELSSRLATRMYWTLNYYGHGSSLVLDGGKAAWTSGGHEMVTDVSPVEAQTYEIGATTDETKTDLDFVMAAIGNPDVVIIDGRPTQQYTGEAPGAAFHTGTQHKRLGHIPGAISIPWKSNFNEDGTFKPTDDLMALYESNGVTKDKTIITYCNEGLHAAPPWFVLSELLGYPAVRLYDDSMAEWANRDDTPMETSETSDS